MLCESITEADLVNLKGEYKANLKFDGERLSIIKVNDDIFLVNRAGREKSFIYPELKELVKDINGDFILDGEVITIDGKFNSLQHRSNLSDRSKIEKAKFDYPITYKVFDLLWLNGENLKQYPLKERVKMLQRGFAELDLVEYQDIQEALSFAKSNKCEGIVVKDMLSTYQSRRSRSWLKMKLFKEADFKAITYTINNAGIRLEDSNLNAVQCSGLQSEAVKRAIDENGYCDIVIQYLEKTKDDRYRFPSFKEIRGRENEF